MRRISIWIGVCCLLFLWAGAAQAQEAVGWMNTPGVSPNEVNEVAREIWCPLCSGVRLDSCELKACDQMKDVIAIKLAEGDNSAQIKDYFLEQYGPQILGEPPREGFNWLAWILPVVVFMGGGVFLFRQAQRLVRPRQEPIGSQPTSQTEARIVSTDEKAAGKPERQLSPEERRLEEELAKYG